MKHGAGTGLALSGIVLTTLDRHRGARPVSARRADKFARFLPQFLRTEDTQSDALDCQVLCNQLVIGNQRVVFTVVFTAGTEPPCPALPPASPVLTPRQLHINPRPNTHSTALIGTTRPKPDQTGEPHAQSLCLVQSTRFQAISVVVRFRVRGRAV